MEEVKLIDDFTNKKTGRTSNCYRISYRSNERSLTDDEINDLQVRQRMLCRTACKDTQSSCARRTMRLPQSSIGSGMSLARCHLIVLVTVLSNDGSDRMLTLCE